jgi:biopolymer transport protein ExbB/TolQ
MNSILGNFVGPQSDKMMYLILLVFILIVGFTVERALYLAKSKVDVDKLMSLLKSQIVAGNIRGAINTCEASPAPLTRIIAAGLRKAGGSEHDVQQAMDEEALRELPKVEKRTGYLAMLSNLATLAGLLGTISGLITSFASVAGVDPSMKATMLAGGISQAMHCTAFGLFSGIIGLATYAWLNGKTQGILDGINQGSVETLNLVVAGRNEGAGFQT